MCTIFGFLCFNAVILVKGVLNMTRVKILSSSHANGETASNLLEGKINDFIVNDLPKFGGSVEDIKITATSLKSHLIVALIRVETN